MKWPELLELFDEFASFCNFCNFPYYSLNFVNLILRHRQSGRGNQTSWEVCNLKWSESKVGSWNCVHNVDSTSKKILSDEEEEQNIKVHCHYILQTEMIFATFYFQYFKNSIHFTKHSLISTDSVVYQHLISIWKPDLGTSPSFELGHFAPQLDDFDNSIPV